MEFTMRSCFLIEIRRIYLFANHNLIEWWTISLQFTKTSLLLPLTFFTWQFLGIQGRFSLLRCTDLITQNHDHLNTASQADQTRPSYLLLVLWACVWHTSFPTAMFFFAKHHPKTTQTKLHLLPYLCFCKPPSKNSSLKPTNKRNKQKQKRSLSSPPKKKSSPGTYNGTFFGNFSSRLGAFNSRNGHWAMKKIGPLVVFRGMKS